MERDGDASSSAYGFTGEQVDGTGLVYLRARYLNTGVGRFLTRDPWSGDVIRPLSQNGFAYVMDNPILYIDPYGLYICNINDRNHTGCWFVIVGQSSSNYFNQTPEQTQEPLSPTVESNSTVCSDCERFVAEVQQIINLAKTQLPIQNDNLVVRMLVGYYSGFDVTFNIGCFEFPIPTFLPIRGTTPERWPIKDAEIYNAVGDSITKEGIEEALRYGFKRIFYENTHHYFANFYVSWNFGSNIARRQNDGREADQYFENGDPYFYCAADILIVEVVNEHVRAIQSRGRFGLGLGLDMLPTLLNEDACGETLEEIYEGWTWPNPIVEDWIGPPPEQ